LAFFENEEGQIVHVGMMLEDQKIIHAYGKVRIDTLDSSGIFNQELKRHTHNLRFIRRLL
jgi:cell wall-associated NlpC family hydrolase